MPRLKSALAVKGCWGSFASCDLATYSISNSGSSNMCYDRFFPHSRYVLANMRSVFGFIV